jgi:hypothetical protein
MDLGCGGSCLHSEEGGGRVPKGGLVNSATQAAWVGVAIAAIALLVQLRQAKAVQKFVNPTGK